MRLKQTAVQPRIKMSPDEYEASVLKWLSAGPMSGGLCERVDGRRRTLRVVMPIYYARTVWLVAGEPKGDLDISGYPKEGHKEVILPERSRSPHRSGNR